MRCLLVLAAAALSIAADPNYASARKKLDLIEASQAPRGSVILFTPAEILAWARVTVPEIIPEGMRDMRIDLGNGTATGFAIVDFLKMRQGKGMTTNWLLTKVIEGERPLRVSVRVDSANGRCTVYLTRVELSNVVASKTVLEFLINTFFKPLYPEAHIDEAFDLDFNIERLEIRPTGARVVIKK